VSKNGTYVNGQEVESHMLEKGDVIELGDTVIAYEK
jgi:pSer/pThr/pTyr-binding forkhead associated (FHA) protein